MGWHVANSLGNISTPSASNGGAVLLGFVDRPKERTRGTEGVESWGGGGEGDSEIGVDWGGWGLRHGERGVGRGGAAVGGNGQGAHGGRGGRGKCTQWEGKEELVTPSARTDLISMPSCCSCEGT